MSWTFLRSSEGWGQVFYLVLTCCQAEVGRKKPIQVSPYLQVEAERDYQEKQFIDTHNSITGDGRRCAGILEIAATVGESGQQPLLLSVEQTMCHKLHHHRQPSQCWEWAEKQSFQLGFCQAFLFLSFKIKISFIYLVCIWQGVPRCPYGSQKTNLED